MANYNGDKKNNTYRGTAARDKINGNDGDDRLFGLGGDDLIDGGAGDDFIDVGTGDDKADGGKGTDTLLVDHANGAARGAFTTTVGFKAGALSGTVASSLGKVTYEGFEVLNLSLGQAADTVKLDGAAFAGRAKATINAGAGTDLLVADLSGLAGVDFAVDLQGVARLRTSVFRNFEAFELKLGGGRNTVTMGAANDKIISGGGVDTVDGGGGSDTYTVATKGPTLGLAFAGATATFSNGSAVSNVEILNVTLGSGAAAVTVTGASDGSAFRINDGVGGGGDLDAFTFVATDATALGVSYDGTAATFSNGSKVLNFEAFDLSFGDGSDTIALSADAYNGIEVDAGAGNDRLTLSDMSVLYDHPTTIVALGDGDDVATASGVVSASIAGGNGADTLTYTAVRAGMTVFAGGDDAAIDTADVSLDKYLVGNDGSYGIAGALTGAANGLAASIIDDQKRGVTFSGIEAVKLVMTRAPDQLTIDRAAIASGLAISASGGGGNDTLAADFSARADTTFVLNTDKSITSSIGTFASFEIFSLTLGEGSNTVTTGIGNDTIVSRGTVDVIDMGGNTKVAGALGVDSYVGTVATADDLAFSYVGGVATVSNGARIAGIEVLDYGAGSGDDSFAFASDAVLTLHGNDGDDVFTISEVSRTPYWYNTQRLYGGGGSDTLNVASYIFTTIDADADGLKIVGNISTGGATGFEAINIVQGGRYAGGVALTKAAVAANLAISVDGGGSAPLRADFSGVDSVSFLADANGVASTTFGTFKGFGTYDLTLATGHSDVKLAGSGTALVRAAGGVDIVDFGATKGTYLARLSDAGEIYTVSAGLLVGGNGTRVSNPQRIDLVGGASDDRFDIVAPLKLVPYSPQEYLPANYSGVIRGGAGNDTFSIDGKASADFQGGLGSDTFILHEGVMRVLGFEDAREGVSGPDTGTDTLILDLAGRQTGGGLIIDAKADGFMSSPSLLGTSYSGIEVIVADLSESNDGISITAAAFASGFKATLDGNGGLDLLVADLSGQRDTILDLVGGGTFTRGNISITSFERFEVTTGAGTNRVVGGQGADRLTGGIGDDTFIGGGDSDTLSGGAGNDTLSGGDYFDYLSGGPGDDYLDGGENTDVLTYENAAAGVTVSLRDGRATGEGVDTLVGFEWVIGSAFDDVLIGSDGSERLSGGDGNDVIEGGLGIDLLSGGGGADRFVYRTLESLTDGERISDFTAGDRYDLSLIDADPTLDGDQAFRLVKTFSTGGTTLEMILSTSGGNPALMFDLDHDGQFDVEIGIYVDSGPVPTASNLIL